MTFFDKIFDAVAWMKIFISPFLAGLIIGLVLWFYSDGILFKVMAVSISIIGFAAGIYFAEKVRKKIGTQEFISTLNATPELDKKKESN